MKTHHYTSCENPFTFLDKVSVWKNPKSYYYTPGKLSDDQMSTISQFSGCILNFSGFRNQKYKYLRFLVIHVGIGGSLRESRVETDVFSPIRDLFKWLRGRFRLFIAIFERRDVSVSLINTSSGIFINNSDFK